MLVKEPLYGILEFMMSKKVDFYITACTCMAVINNEE